MSDIPKRDDKHLDLPVQDGLRRIGRVEAVKSVAQYCGPMTTRERLHKLVDELSEQKAGTALVLLERRRDDPMLRALAAAPLDDEPSDLNEDRAAAAALAAYREETSGLEEQRNERQ